MTLGVPWTSDSLLFHPLIEERAGELWGMATRPMPESLLRTDIIVLILLLSLLLILLLHRKIRKRFLEMLNGFLFPINFSSATNKHKESRRELHCLIMAVLLSLEGSVIAFAYTHEHIILRDAYSPWLLIGLYVLGLFGVLVLKQFLYRFVHFVFFSASQRQRWREDIFFLFLLESLSVFPIVLLLVFLRIELQLVFILFVSTSIFLKMWQLWKAFSTFFGNFYGILHLFVYFCALEVAPLLILWHFFVRISNQLSII